MTQEELKIYREALKTHIARSVARGNEDMQNWWVEFIESNLLDFIRQSTDVSVESIYDITDTKLIGSLQSAANISLPTRRSLQIYGAFLVSKWHPIRATAKKNLGKGEKKREDVKQAAKVPAKPIIKLVEGAVLQERDRDIHKRNPKLRQLCIEAYGNEYKCIVCGMNFVERYGEIGKEFIEVHHLYPISETDGEHEVDPATEMIPLCSNCHSMIHRLEDPADWQKLKEIFETENE